MEEARAPELPGEPGAADVFAGLPAEAQAALQGEAARLAAMTSDERGQAEQERRREQLAHQADQAVEAALDALRRGRAAALASRLDEAAAYFARGQSPETAYGCLAQFMEALARLLRGAQAGPVPPEYAGRLAAVEDAIKR